ncbi:MAG: dTMP kinase [Alphaproteobacteria bacterium]|nr:dTMP kinase [Alphaproteobacteria bacterium]
MKAGRFITLEGGEGSGKTTQIRLLQSAFAAAGTDTLFTREPGGTDGADQIRALLLRADAESWDDVAELLLFYAARREHIVKRVRPALAQGKTVICDRFADSSRIYQGVARGLGDDFVLSLHRLTLGDFQPDVTLWLDVDVEAGLGRTQGREAGAEETRFENQQRAFHHRVREGFTALAAREPQRIARIDAHQSIAKVHADIIHALNNRLGLNLPVMQEA